MATITDGGPAFAQSVARTDDGGATCSYDFVDGAGMSLRDYFAAKALPTLVAAFMEPNSAWDSYDEVADSAYLLAEAMLRRRATLTPYDRDTARACRGAQSPAERQAEHLKEFGK